MLRPFRAAAICLKVRMNGSPKSFSLLKRLIRVLKYAFCTVSQNGFSGKGRKGMFSFGRGGKPALRNRAKRRYSIRSADRSATGYRPDRSAAKRSRRRGIGKTRSRPKRCRSVRVRCRARGPIRIPGKNGSRFLRPFPTKCRIRRVACDGSSYKSELSWRR